MSYRGSRWGGLLLLACAVGLWNGRALAEPSQQSIRPQTAAPVGAFGGQPVVEPASDADVNIYTDADGTSFFALAVQPFDQVSVPRNLEREVVILVDTSASQTGTYRASSLDAVRTVLKSLAATDRVKLVALDLTATSLTDGFVPPRDAAMVAGFKRLLRRVPLGATDLIAGLQTAMESWQEPAKQARVILYIGDGLSHANLIDRDELEGLVKQLVSRRVSVHAYALGDRLDAQLLMALANHTGGNLFLDGPEVTGTQAGAALAQYAHSPVWWPTSVSLPESLRDHYPRNLPPLRQDRASVLIGTLGELKETGSGPSGLPDTWRVRVVAELAGEPATLEWTISRESSTRGQNPDMSYLPQLTRLARQTGGWNLVTLGRQGLEFAGSSLLAESEQLGKMAAQAAASGNWENAQHLVEAALMADPANPEAESVKRLVEKQLAAPPAATKEADKSVPADETAQRGLPTIRWRPVLFQEPDADDGLGSDDPFSDEPLDEPAAPETVPPPAESAPAETAPAEPALPADDGALDASPPDGVEASPETADFGSPPPVDSPDGLLLENELERQRLQTDILRAEVADALSRARQLMSRDPAGVRQELKFLLEEIRTAPDIREDVRLRLSDEIERAIIQAGQRQIEKEQREQVQQANRATALSRLQWLDEVARREERIATLLSQFNQLLDERKFALAVESAQRAAELSPRDAAPAAALAKATHASALARYNEIRARRHHNFLESMLLVEAAAVPTPDDPPIVYPENFRELTERRKPWREAVDLTAYKGPEKKIYDALNQSIDLTYAETSLSEVVSDLHDRLGINIQLDSRALDELGVSSDTPITASYTGITFRKGLRHILRNHDLTYMVRDEVLLITTPDVVDAEMVTRVYPVADLVVPTTPLPAGGGGLGGGLTSGLNGGGGGGGFGGGGGGLGGGGGFGGGGGGGFGGGGFGGGGFGGGGFFDVADSVSLESPDSPQSPAADPAEAANLQANNDQTAEPISLTVRPNETPERAWDRYFRTNRPADAAVRATVRQRMNERQFEQVEAIIQAALRNQQPQYWMYQTLAIALEARQAPQPELERALMSAVDLSADLDQLMLVASYLSRTGSHARALSLLKDISASQPTRPEPHVLALQIAQKTKDQGLIRDACLGVLEQAWPKKYEHVAQQARNLAQQTLDRLQQEGDSAAADSFLQALRAASVRDVVAVVSWTGEADIDLLMKEPAGTVCQAREPRSVGGGVLLGDEFSHAKNATVDGCSEIYVCSQGFAGEYQLLIKRIWGKVTASKVTVDIFTHYGTDKQQRIRRQVPLQDGNTLVKFELDAGQRSEPLAPVQIAEAARQQLAVNQAILAQHMDNAADDSVLQDLALSRRFGVNPLNPLIGRLRGAVGYRPVITSLPEGAQLLALAVVSYDRRYARVSPAPFFSHIAEVQTFNFASGQGQNQGGGGDPFGGGGGGFGGGGGGGGFGGGGF